MQQHTVEPDWNLCNTLLADHHSHLALNDVIECRPTWKTQYTEKMRPILKRMQEEATKNSSKLLMFRESSAQHFFSFSGDGSWESFNKETGNACWIPNDSTPTPNFNNGTCNPRLLVRTCAPAPEGSDWRNEIIRDLLAEEEIDKVPILQLFNVTKSRWDLHEDQRNITTWKKGDNVNCRNGAKCQLPGGGGQDCTHFSYTPFLYEPTWDEIYSAMERVGWDV